MSGIFIGWSIISYGSYGLSHAYPYACWSHAKLVSDHVQFVSEFNLIGHMLSPVSKTCLHLRCVWYGHRKVFGSVMLYSIREGLARLTIAIHHFCLRVVSTAYNCPLILVIQSSSSPSFRRRVILAAYYSPSPSCTIQHITSKKRLSLLLMISY